MNTSPALKTNNPSRLGWVAKDEFGPFFGATKEEAEAARASYYSGVSEHEIITLARMTSMSNNYEGGSFISASFNREGLIAFARALRAAEARRIHQAAEREALEWARRMAK